MTYRVYGKTYEDAATAGNLMIVYKADRLIPDEMGQELGRTTADPATGRFEVQYSNWPGTVNVVGIDLSSGSKRNAKVVDWVVGDYIGSDQHYGNIAVLMNFDGSNGSNVFVDDGPDSHTPNSHGNVQHSNAQFQFGGTSALFDGSGDYITVPSDASFDLGSSNYTIEMCVYPTSLTGTQTLVARRDSADPTVGSFAVQLVGNALKFDALHSGGLATATAGTLTLNQWNHLALVRLGSSFFLYVDGEQVGSFISALDSDPNAFDISIGAESNGANAYSGYMDCFRYTVGTARHVQDYFPLPTSALPTEQGHVGMGQTTVFLSTHNAALGAPPTSDDSSWGHTITEVPGNTGTIIANGEFGGSRSLQFNGNANDGLRVAWHPYFVIRDQQNFTFEFWLKLDATSGTQAVMVRRTGDTAAGSFVLRTNNSTFQFYFRKGGSWATDDTPGLSAGTWHHIAVVRNQGVITCYLDGAAGGSDNYTGATVETLGDLAIGSDPWAGQPLNGELMDIRISIGTARYTAPFTPPTQPNALV